MNEELNSPTTLGAKIDALKAMRDERTQLNNRVDELTRQMAALEQEIIALLDEQGTTQSRAKAATATISEQEVPIAEDWDAIYQFIWDNKAFYLLQRRLSSAPIAELRAAGMPVPGTKPFIKRTLSLRSL